MPGCAAPRCTNRSEKGTLMKAFPRDAERRALWVERVNRKGWTPTTNSYLCEDHFSSEQWEKTREDGSRRLKVFAVPDVFHPTEHNAKRKAVYQGGRSVKQKFPTGAKHALYSQEAGQEEADDIDRTLQILELNIDTGRTGLGALENDGYRRKYLRARAEVAVLRRQVSTLTGHLSGSAKDWCDGLDWEAALEALSVKFASDDVGYAACRGMEHWTCSLPPWDAVQRYVRKLRTTSGGIPQQMAELLIVKARSLSDEHRDCALFADTVRMPEGTQGLLLTAAALTGAWTQILAYQPLTSLSMADIRKAVKIVAEMLDAAGLRLRAVTADLESGVLPAFGIVCQPDRFINVSPELTCVNGGSSDVFFLPNISQTMAGLVTDLSTEKDGVALPQDIVKRHSLLSDKVQGVHVASMGKSTQTNGDADDIRTTAWFVELENRWFSCMTRGSTLTALSKLRAKEYEETVAFLREFAEVMSVARWGGQQGWTRAQEHAVLVTKSVLGLAECLLEGERVDGFATDAVTRNYLAELMKKVQVDDIFAAIHAVCVEQYLRDIKPAQTCSEREFVARILQESSFESGKR